MARSFKTPKKARTTCKVYDAYDRVIAEFIPGQNGVTEILIQQLHRHLLTASTPHARWRLFLRADGVRIPAFLRLSPGGRYPIRLLEWRKSVTPQQKEQISKLRASGASYGSIATALGISVNTIKSYCKRNPVSNEPAPTVAEAIHS